jgi:hypothetical protein
MLYVSADPTGGDATATIACTEDAGVPFTMHENGQFTNPSDPFDVNGDGLVAPFDALMTINELNHAGPRLLLGPHQDPPYFDVNDDEYVTAQDVLHVINRLNAALEAVASEGPSVVVVGEGETPPLPASDWERTAWPAAGATWETGTGADGPDAEGSSILPGSRSEARGLWGAKQEALESILASRVEERGSTAPAGEGWDSVFEDGWELDLLDLDRLATERGRR